MVYYRETETKRKVKMSYDKTSMGYMDADDYKGNRIDNIGQNGNDGEHYADKVARFLLEPNALVENPPHYQLGNLGVEVIDVIDSVLSSDEAKAWLNPFEGGQYTGVLERILRAPKKDKLQDLKKAHKQLGWLIESLEDY